MTREDIIRMAREAGLEAYSILPHKEIDWDCLVDDLATFATLVAAAEQDRCCKIIYSMAGSDNVAQRTVDAIRGKQ